MSILIKPTKLNKLEKQKFPDFTGITIIIYSDAYFDLFFERHCDRKHPSVMFTVVVIGEEGKPSETDMRKALERLFVSKEFLLKKGVMFATLPAPYFARTATDDGIQKDEVPAPCVLRFEDVCEVSYTDMNKLLSQKAIGQEDVSAVKEIRRNAESNKVLIKAVWFIGHVDVVKGRR